MGRWVLTEKNKTEELKSRELTGYDGSTAKLIFATPPCNAASTGKLYVEYPDEARGETTPEVFGLKWRYIE